MEDSKPNPQARQCGHGDLPEVTFDPDSAAGLTAREVRARWPRGDDRCPTCGAMTIVYASFLHYVSGDW